jgi:hypothetical protein
VREKREFRYTLEKECVCESERERERDGDSFIYLLKTVVEKKTSIDHKLDAWL